MIALQLNMNDYTTQVLSLENTDEMSLEYWRDVQVMSLEFSNDELKRQHGWSLSVYRSDTAKYL